MIFTNIFTKLFLRAFQIFGWMRNRNVMCSGSWNEKYERQNSITECVARFIFALLLCQRIIERRMDDDKLVVHFAGKKTYTKKGKRMSKLAHICRVDSHLLWEPLYRKYLFVEIFFPSPAKNVFKNFFTIVIVDQRLSAVPRFHENSDSRQAHNKSCRQL